MNNVNKKFVFILTLIFTLLMFSLTYADGGSIVINCSGYEANFSIYKIADEKGDTEDAFAGLDIDFTDIKTAEDMKAFRYLYENVEYEPDYDLTEKRLKNVGDNGIVVMYTPKSPLMELVALKAGIETVVTELMAEEPEEFEELLECMEEKHTIAAQIAIDSPAEYIFVPENLSSETVGGSLYDNYLQDIHRDWNQRIHKAGKKSMVHLDGTLNPLLSKLSRNGFDVIEAVTPKPVGDIALEDLRKYVEKDTIIWGGFPSGFFADSFPEEEFDKWVKNALEIIKKDGRFVLGVADQIVPGTSLKRVRRVSELIQKYGKCQ